MSDRAIVFIDAQNMYRGARRAFFAPTDAHMFGQFHPRALGERVASHGRPGDAQGQTVGAWGRAELIAASVAEV